MELRERIAFAVLNNEFKPLYDELMKKKIVCVPIRQVANFCYYCAGFKNIQPNGGALTDDGKQYLYI